MKSFKRVDKETSTRDEHRIVHFTWIITALLLISVPITCYFYGGGDTLMQDFRMIIISPSQLVTDYFKIGSISATLLNAGLAGLICNLIMKITNVRPTQLILAGYLLVVAHCFYGLNILNMWPPFLGVMLFCYIEKERLGNSLHLAMFSTALAPFVSEFLFRYLLGDAFVVGEYVYSFRAIILAVGFGIVAGFFVPSLLQGTTKTHRGHNLFKAGLAIGIFGMFAYAFLYKVLGVTTPEPISYVNPLFYANEGSYYIFYNILFLVIFVGALIFGFFENGKSFKGYKKIWDSDSLDQNFPKDHGVPLTFINFGLYGLFILLYYNVVIFGTTLLGLPGVDTSSGFTGATFGVVLAAVTFAGGGQTIRNVWPIALGYIIVYVVSLIICSLGGTTLEWSLASQGYINGFAFATGLCPFSGRFGWKAGVAAGMLQAILCTSVATMHGGFVLYNGGFASGLTALVLLPIHDFYKKKKDDIMEIFKGEAN